jgi:ATP-dependent Clp protease protease subunit
MSKVEQRFGMLHGFPEFGGNCIWVTDFDQSATLRFFEQFLELEKNPAVKIIPVFISSYGGEVYSLLAMRDLMKSSSKPVATIAVGMAMSCGASLLAAGTKGLRFAATSTDIMVHQVSAMTAGKTSDVIEGAMAIARLNDQWLNLFAKDTGRPIHKIKKAITDRHNTDWIMSPEEAKHWGIVDEIGLPRLMSYEPEVVLAKPLSFDSKKASKARKRPKKEEPKPKKDEAKTKVKKDEPKSKKDEAKTKVKSKKKNT